MRIRHPALESIAARAFVGSLRLLFRTVRNERHFSRPESTPYSTPGDERYIYCVWHDSLIMPLFIGRQKHTTALVGMHRDGTFLTSGLKALGIPSVRGSSSRGGAQAVRHILNDTHDRHIAMTPDGPRGPRRIMKAGCAFCGLANRQACRTDRDCLPPIVEDRHRLDRPGHTAAVHEGVCSCG